MVDRLAIEALASGYGEARIIRNVSFTLGEGQGLALLGRNGTGKTTLINSIMGLTRHQGGMVRLSGRDITRLRPDQRAHAGLGWVPQERNIFRSLTVEENLTATARAGEWSLARVYAAFPRLKERRANMGHQLSGGEQQMLAVGRALMTNPLVLLLDEPLEGLAPIIVDELLGALQSIVAQGGLSTIIAEQSARRVLRITQKVVILDRGSVLHQGESAALLQDDDAMHRLLGVG